MGQFSQILLVCLYIVLGLHLNFHQSEFKHFKTFHIKNKCKNRNSSSQFLIQALGFPRKQWPWGRKFTRFCRLFWHYQMKHLSHRNWRNSPCCRVGVPQISVISLRHPLQWCKNKGNRLGSLKHFNSHLIDVYLGYTWHPQIFAARSVPFDSGGKIETDFARYEDPRNSVHIFVLSLDNIWQL